ncbi:protein MIX23-like [Lineus longissimus]|uniref:protein MIX23-like n=1 Tax=Lineus longissimus TaxID=88925 RepID=UPI002B4C5CA4
MAVAGSDRNLPCDDFMQFQTKLKQLRLIDDRIANALNRTVPTASFAGNVDAKETCKGLYHNMTEAYGQREAAIKVCIKSQDQIITKLRGERDAFRQKDQDNFELERKLRGEQTKLRLMQSELQVEGILRKSSLKVYYERCRDYHKPDENLS